MTLPFALLLAPFLKALHSGALYIHCPKRSLWHGSALSETHLNSYGYAPPFRSSSKALAFYVKGGLAVQVSTPRNTLNPCKLQVDKGTKWFANCAVQWGLHLQWSHPLKNHPLTQLNHPLTTRQSLLWELGSAGYLRTRCYLQAS